MQLDEVSASRWVKKGGTGKSSSMDGPIDKTDRNLSAIHVFLLCSHLVVEKRSSVIYTILSAWGATYFFLSSTKEDLVLSIYRWECVLFTIFTRNTVGSLFSASEASDSRADVNSRILSCQIARKKQFMARK